MPVETDQSISDFTRSLGNINLVDPSVKNHLTKYLLIVTCAAFEDRIKKSISTRLSKSADSIVKRYAEKSTFKVSLRISEIRGIMNRFKEDLGLQLDLVVTAPQVTTYSNIITNRNAVAHTGHCEATYEEFTSWLPDADHVIDQVCTIIESAA